MTYDTSSITVDCGSCGSHIFAGAPIYRVTRAKLLRCSSCVRRMGLEYLSPAEAVQAREAPEPLSFARFQRKTVGADLRARIRDARKVGSE